VSGPGDLPLPRDAGPPDAEPPAAGPPPELLAWAVAALGGSGRAGVRVTGLREGGSPWQVELGSGGCGVLRVLDVEARPRLVTELAAVQHAAAHGLPVPVVLAADVDGAVAPGRVAVLTSLLPGTSRAAGGPPPPARFRALGALAARLAAVPAPEASAALPPRTRPIPDVDFAALRRGSRPRPLLVAAEETLAEREPPPRPPSFVHGDLWQGNTLWDGADDGDRLSGVVDWDSAGVGPAGIDLGSLRCDAAMTAGAQAAQAVLAGYEGVLGRPADDVAYWDVVAALCTPPEVGWFADAIRDQGRDDLDRPTLLRRRDAFLRTALDRLV
jgi:Ser/Thr protein kinase RdoA (MazF antagonist)